MKRFAQFVLLLVAATLGAAEAPKLNVLFIAVHDSNCRMDLVQCDLQTPSEDGEAI